MRFFFERFFISVLPVFLMCTPVGAHADAIMRIAVFGDSLMSGYKLQPDEAFPGRLEKKLKDVGFTNIEVMNLSLAGETTAGGLERVSSVLVKNPDIVVVGLGGNDAIRGINPDLIYKNLMEVVRKLKERNIYVVLVGIKAPESMGYSYGKQLEAVFERIALVNKVAFYPNALQGIVGKPELNLADGYHPNSKGVDIMVEGLYRLVDAGLRWKWEVLQYQEQWKNQNTQGSSTSSTIPAPSGEIPSVPNQAPSQPVLP